MTTLQEVFNELSYRMFIYENDKRLVLLRKEVSKAIEMGLGKVDIRLTLVDKYNRKTKQEMIDYFFSAKKPSPDFPVDTYQSVLAKVNKVISNAEVLKNIVNEQSKQLEALKKVKETLSRLDPKDEAELWQSLANDVTVVSLNKDNKNGHSGRQFHHLFKHVLETVHKKLPRTIASVTEGISGEKALSFTNETVVHILGLQESDPAGSFYAFLRNESIADVDKRLDRDEDLIANWGAWLNEWIKQSLSKITQEKEKIKSSKIPRNDNKESKEVLENINLKIKKLEQQRAALKKFLDEMSIPSSNDIQTLTAFQKETKTRRSSLHKVRDKLSNTVLSTGRPKSNEDFSEKPGKKK